MEHESTPKLEDREEHQSRGWDIRVPSSSDSRARRIASPEEIAELAREWMGIAWQAP